MKIVDFSLRRLDPYASPDIELLELAYKWNTVDSPDWYLDAEQVWGPDTWDETLERSRRSGQIEVGVFDSDCEFCSLLTLELVSTNAFEVYIAAPRKSNSERTTLAAFAVCKQLLLDDGIADNIISWCCARHLGAIRLSKACGSIEDGVSMLKRTPSGRVLEWKRLILTRERMRDLIYGQTEEANEHLRVSNAA